MGCYTSRAYIKSSSNLLEIFHSLCKNPFTKSEPHRDNSSLVFMIPYNLRDPWSLNQSLRIRRGRRIILSLREEYYN